MSKINDYMAKHPDCEACHKPAYGMPHHIKTRGSGGTDEAENLLRLCWGCHYGTVHGTTKGIRLLVEKYPHLYDKIVNMKPKIRSKE
jgi:hypothetical protein